MTIHIEMCLVRLALRFEQHRRFANESDSDLVRSGLHRNTKVKVGVGSVLKIDNLVWIRPLSLYLRPYGEDLQTDAIERDFNLVWLVQTLNAFVAVTCQTELQFILAVAREIIANKRSAAGS